jgi:hypothetical protein
MATKGEERICSTCNVFTEVLELIPDGAGWYTQKLNCGHTGRIRIMEPIEEKVEIKDEVKNVTTKFIYGQVQAEKTTKDSRVFPASVDTEEISISSYQAILAIITVTYVSV